MHLFVDFRKSFHFLNSKLFLKKLGAISRPLSLKLGIGQGSILCFLPLFFIIYINDLPLLLANVPSTFFADNRTLVVSDANFDMLINKFNKLVQLQFNPKLDLNGSKTKVMFVSKQIISNQSRLRKLFSMEKH
jgi:hypothetical protein